MAPRNEDQEEGVALAKVLVVENDPVIAAVLEDRLRVAGHQIQILRESGSLIAVADEKQADLVVLEVPGAASVETIQELRRHPGTRTVAVMVLSDSNEPVDRIAALKAGADDYLARPFDLEELGLRCDRLLGTRIANLHMLQGDLSTHPLWALLQYLRQVHRSGNLRVRGSAGSGGSGTVELRHGELASARWGNLRGDEALLALLCMEEGSFRLDEDTDAGAAPGPVDAELPMTELLMRAAWLKDEIEKRRHLLPATGEPLVALAASVPAGVNEAHLPLQRILARVHRLPGTRVFDLMADETEAPLTTRLAVAWLVEHKLLGSLRDQSSAVATQNTMEISSGIIFDVAIDDLIAAAAAAGLPATALPYLVLVEPAAWPELRKLLEKAPGFARNESLQKIVEQVELRRAGSASFASPRGKLSLHVQVLTAAAQPQIAAIVPSCAGALVWLDEAAALETARHVVQRLEASRLAASGMLVSSSPAANKEAERLAQGTKRWRTSASVPQSFLGILRLLHPRESR
jgi:CheY-like chemotaxis protein